MKKYITIIGFAFGTILQVHSQGYIVPDGVYMGSFLPNEIDVVQSPTTHDYTGFWLLPVVANTFSFDGYADDGVRVFLVSSGDPISLEAILANNYTELTFPNTYVFANGSRFYVGLYTGYGPQNGIYADPLFGWARLINNNGAIELLSGALEYGGAGIYAGTQTIIPEPSAMSLVALGSLLLGWRLRRAK